MTTKPTAELRPHPKNVGIYGDHADTDLIESIRAKGILTPLLITADGHVISGNRRLEAARRLNLPDVPVVLFGSSDELDILEALIESNRQRHKTNEQLGREALTLMEVEAERARRRQAVETRSLQENFPEVKPGQARDAVGEKLGVSGKQAEKAATVVTAIDNLASQGKQREAGQLRQALNDKSVHAAYTKAQEAGYIAPSAAPRKPAVMPDYYTLADWQRMSEAEQWSLLNTPRNRNAKMNNQENNNIEWALWSWNPVTGCLHNCSYCYARDIAERFYAQKFVPSFVPGRLSAPANTPVPAEAADSLGYKNVFTCSMADLFGRWVPREWIEAVLQVVADNSQWNFLFLTNIFFYYIVYFFFI
jgi:ParB-like chromosome segregation protein Spo0J